MPILNYTTTVAAEKTVSEIQSILGRKGASHVSVDYVSGKVTAVTFGLSMDGFVVNFRLPCNALGVKAALLKDNKNKMAFNPAQCERIAWRIVKDWVEAQMALVEAQQAELAEVFMPYVIYAGSTTIFHAIKSGQLALPAASPVEPTRQTIMLGDGR